MMGGSLARALKALPKAPEIVGMTASDLDAEEALAAGVIDALAASAAEAFEGAGLIVYAVPLGVLVELLPQHADHAENAEGAPVLTDVSSLKRPVLDAVQRLGLTDRFVGCHPMVGGEGSGFGTSREALYSGATVWVAEEAGTPEAHGAVEKLWLALGAHPRKISADTHDQNMVWASHLPQLCANALARAIDGAGLTPTELGPGGRDMTRLAASSPTMWRDLIDHASALDAAALHVVAGELEAIADALERGSIEGVTDMMEETRRWRLGTKTNGR